MWSIRTAPHPAVEPPRPARLHRSSPSIPNPLFRFFFAWVTLRAMQLLTGPAGSGKTAFCLARARQAIQAGEPGFRLLTPTATMARHLRNQLAREGLVFRARMIQTLHGFVKEWAGETPEASEPVLYLIVEEVAQRVARPEFARVAALPGFCASLAGAIAEFAAAGCAAARLRNSLPDTPLGAAFLAVYDATERELERRGLALRAQRLERAAARIAAKGAAGIGAVWLDGFHALPEPELHVIAALGRHAEVTLTFESAEPRLLAIGFREERQARLRPSPARQVVRAPSIEREAEEIARRILDQAAAGRPFREMGIVVRSPDTYVPLLRSTLERFGIPARFYFDQNLEEHAVTRFLAGAVDALQGGWDHAQTMAVLRLDAHLADSNALDRMDFEVRKQTPNRGLEALRALAAGDRSLLQPIDSLQALEEWIALTLPPKDWAARLRRLRGLFRLAPPAHAMVLEQRTQAEALRLFDEALEEAATALDPGGAGHQDSARPSAIPLATFWRAVKSVLRLKPLRLSDGRRNVVHVLSAPEARQWVLPVVFVCGMVQKSFPQVQPPHVFFPDEARRRLNAAGIRVRTAADFEREERALFDSAVSRATMLVTVSYPQFDARGERNVRSLFLDDWAEPEETTRAVRPATQHPVSAPAPSPIHAAPLLEFLRQRTARLSPTRLESFLQCPFQHFAGRTLHLKPPPPRPEARLDFLTQGEIVHQVLADWFRAPQDLEPLFDRIFAEHRDKKRIPLSFQSERTRNNMLDHVRAFLEQDEWPRAEFRSRVEQAFQIPIGDWLLSGKIDRLDEDLDPAHGRAFVIDYKYSRAENTRKKLKDENLLQAPLYLMAAERFFGIKPTGMFYIGLKGSVEYVGWSEPVTMQSDPLPPNWIAETEQRALRIVDDIRAGHVEVAPANRDHCRFCDAHDVCRVEVRVAAAVPAAVAAAEGDTARAPSDPRAATVPASEAAAERDTARARSDSRTAAVPAAEGA
jgi:ATP-dependent helicase/DNAse subunit B